MKYYTEIDKLPELEKSFHNACVDGNLNQIKKLINSKKINIHCNNDAGFLLACSNGHLDIVDYFLTSPELKKHIDINTNDDMGFLNACFRGQLHIVKYLLTSPKLNKYSNIHAYKDRAFEITCQHNNLELAQFLIIDMNIKKTWHINRHLKESENSEIRNYFKVRKFKEQLNSELTTNHVASNKFKI